MVTQITVCYSPGRQKTISEHTARYSLKKMGHGIGGQNHVPLLWSLNRRLEKTVRIWCQSKHPSILPCINGSDCCWSDGVEDVWWFSCLPIKHYLNTTTASLSIAMDHFPPFMTISPKGYTSTRLVDVRHKALIASNRFLVDETNFNILELPPRSPGLNLKEPHWDLTEQEVCSWQIWQSRGILMSIWTKASRGMFPAPGWICAT